MNPIIQINHKQKRLKRIKKNKLFKKIKDNMSVDVVRVI